MHSTQLLRLKHFLDPAGISRISAALQLRCRAQGPRHPTSAGVGLELNEQPPLGIAGAPRRPRLSTGRALAGGGNRTSGVAFPGGGCSFTFGVA
ncbi:hypothetical protein JOF29_006368 [Kribbella aluminosa]|uniref:Uncharacterized protein n=1 Tax=Kribbella aluminosa TaxID=416017 RepID=A0ABS4UUD2_9ACTN|nr:hypothetical protein [Kribbella aluminosa]